ncbi:hypothetical protein BRADI_5g13410v3 [Brachypodium distachyon]|uniref:Uncharacterized protein n=1 Tax=Brachypodium distachyon TaxID=15368 RepID=A0A0Q3H4I1_BRADI|nr:hypothetical protein BRADI_5g13410v3 [Brachypodium distachyon]
MESDPDMEKQQPLLLQPTAQADGSKTPLPLPLPGAAGCCKCRPCSCSSPTEARTLALVVAASGAAFAVQLVAREEYVLLAVFASQLLSFVVLTSLLALCALPEPEPDQGLARRRRRLAWARAAAGQVLLWSFAMALLASMALWVAQSAPVALGAVLFGLALAVVFACYAELVQSLWAGQ